jgi:hypothetical protein
MKKQPILELRPTQFAVGMLEIDHKLADLRELPPRKLKAYLNSTEVPVVIGPDHELYVVDHHHFLCVCYQLGVAKVKVKILADLSTTRMTYSEFWRWMTKHHYVYPYCQFGEGPRKPLYLPRDIRGMADDPYRSLAWFVRKSGAFDNSKKNFAEFRWANFFRSKGLLDREGHLGIPNALIKAIKLAHSPAASKLPGYGKLGLESSVKRAKKKVQKKVKTLIHEPTVHTPALGVKVDAK